MLIELIFRRMDNLELDPFEAPTVSNVAVKEDSNSSFLHEYKLEMSVDEGGSERQFGFTSQRNSIAILLYHRHKGFMVTRQFRPAVFVSRVLELPKNNGKSLELINWKDEDRKLGCTFELCSGNVKDCNQDMDDRAIEVIEEEFGLHVDKQYLQFNGSFLTGVSDSGASCHLYYAELDSLSPEDILSEGKVHREWINVFYADVRDRSKEKKAEKKVYEDMLMSTTHYYALLWWYMNYYFHDRPPMENVLYNVDIDWTQFELGNGLVQGKWTCEEMNEIERKSAMRVEYTIDNVTKTRNFVYRPDTVAILIEDWDTQEYVLTRRFRPAVMAGRVKALSENEDIPLEQIGFSAYPRSCQYTYELGSGEFEEGENAEEAVLRVAEQKLGYKLTSTELFSVARLVIDSIDGGQSMYVYYAKCGAANRMKDWMGTEGDVERVKLDNKGTDLKPMNSPPSLHVALTWGKYKTTPMTPGSSRKAVAEREKVKKGETETDDMEKEEEEIEMESLSNEEEESMEKRKDGVEMEEDQANEGEDRKEEDDEMTIEDVESKKKKAEKRKINDEEDEDNVEPLLKNLKKNDQKSAP